MAYVFLLAFAGAALLTFFNLQTFFARGVADARGLFDTVPLLLLLLVPALTMRLWSEEEKQGTLEVLLTLPVPPAQLVAGKFLASMSLLALGLALTLGLPLTAAFLGPLDWGPVIGGYLGALLLGAAYLAIGQFVSATTDNQLLAFLLALAACLGLYGLGSDAFAGLFSDRAAAFLRALGAGSRFESIARGVIDLRDLLYYLSLTAFFLLLCVLSLEAKRAPRARAVLPRAGGRAAWLTPLLLGANLVVLQVLAAGASGARLDLTRDRRYSIHPASSRLLRSLEEPVTVLGYFSRRTHPKLAPLVPELADFLDEYRAASGGRLRVLIRDPGEDETTEREANDRYGVQSTPFRLASKYESGIVNAYFALVVRYGDRYVRYGFDDLIQVEPLPDGDVDVRFRNLEYDLTRAVKKAVSEFRGTAELFERVGEPVTFLAILTPSTLPEVFSGIPEAVREAARELGERAEGRFRYEELDPATDPQAAGRVQREFGARPMSLGLLGGGSFYLYGLLRVGDRYEQIPLVRESLTAADLREAIEAVLRRQTPGFQKTVGLVAPGPSLPPEVLQQLQMQGQRMPPPEYEQIRVFLEQDYRVERVSLGDARGVSSDIDVLLVVDPRNLGEIEVYNLDQYLMRGGRVVLCAGRFRPSFEQMGLEVLPVVTGLEGWLAHHGIEVRPELVLDDRNQPLPIPETRLTVLGPMRTWSLKPYPYLIAVQQDGFVNREVTGGLDGVGIYWGSPVSAARDTARGATVYELLRSSRQSWTDDDLSRTAYVEYTVPDTGLGPELLAVALSGRFRSYFADRAPPRLAGPDSVRTAAPALERSPETRLTVIGDAAFLSDLVAGVLSQPEGGFFLQNLRFVQNLIDWSALDNDLVAIRSQGGGAPRLARLDKAAEISVETVNYLAPVALLVLLATSRFVARRRTRPISEPANGGPADAEEET
jgi:ABC-2 type transport system permease protein